MQLKKKRRTQTNKQKPQQTQNQTNNDNKKAPQPYNIISVRETQNNCKHLCQSMWDSSEQH